MKQLNPQEYWERRLSKRLDLTTVGHSGLGSVYNGWLYRARARALHRALKVASVKTSGVDIAEIGVGSGAWIPYWLKQDTHRITGLDITSVSVTTLSMQYPQQNFIQCDIGQPVPLVCVFDIVTAFDVLFHITDDSAFACAIANIAELLKAGGVAIISDSFCTQPYGPFTTEYHRTRDHFLHELAANGLEYIHFEPIFFTMTSTLCRDTAFTQGLSWLSARLLRVVSRFSRRRQTEWLNHLIGGSLCLVDGVLGSALDSGPSLNYLLARKL